MSQLCFDHEGRFRILQLTDIHYENRPKDRKSLYLLKDLCERTAPDLIMITGDSVYGPNNARDIHDVLTVVSAAGRPWSLVFGNHDFEDGSDKRRLYDEIRRHPHCLMGDDPEAGFGVGNHYLKLANRQGRTEWLLFGLDSGGMNANPLIGGYDYIKKVQIEWYRKILHAQASEAALDSPAHGQTFSSLIFMHIPLMEFREVWEHETCFGERLEAVCAPRTNSGFFHAMAEDGHTKGVFAGHDHINSYRGQLYGITLCYGRASGYGGYGREGFLPGARAIDLREGETEYFSTFEILADGVELREPARHEAERTEDYE